MAIERCRCINCISTALTGGDSFSTMATMLQSTAPTRQRGVFIAEVIDNKRICREHYLLRLRLDQFPPTRPGQFVQLQCHDLSEQVTSGWSDWSGDRPGKLSQSELVTVKPLLRRPFSLAGRRDAGGRVELDIIYRTIGTGTHWLAGAGSERHLSLIGPLGNSFSIPPTKPHAALVGGGVGIPPMLYLAEGLASAGKKVVAFSGARTADLLPLDVTNRADVPRSVRPARCIRQFNDRLADSIVATDDGSLGYPGIVSRAFDRWLDQTAVGPGQLTVYACGPEPMMRAVGQTCIERGIECQLAMERHMACGMGTCQSCVVKIRSDDKQGWAFRLCCTDGPIFDARDIIWD